MTLTSSADLSDNKAEGKTRNHHWWERKEPTRTQDAQDASVVRFGPPVTHDRKLESHQARRLGAKVKEKTILQLTEPKIEEEQTIVDPYADYVDPET